MANSLDLIFNNIDIQKIAEPSFSLLLESRLDMLLTFSLLVVIFTAFGITLAVFSFVIAVISCQLIVT